MNEKLKMKEEMTKVIHRYNLKGWSPATSCNFSFRTAEDKEVICISKSGVDKAEFSIEDFMDVDLKGNALPAYSGIKSSAETLIHCKIYELFPSTMVILHSHGPQNVTAGLKSSKTIEFCGYEVQKGFDGVKSHEEKLALPILPTPNLKA